MMKRVVFFNHWHNGDVHVSRGMVKLIMNKVHQSDPSVVFEYSHRNAPSLLADIPNLGFNSHDVTWLAPHSGLTRIGDTTYINTWYDQQNQRFARQWGILTIDALFAALDEACQAVWGFHLQDTSDDMANYFPSIDYSKFETESAKQWLSDHPEPKILIESGKALSNQANNFDMIPIVIELANQHPDKTFIISQKENRELPSNVACTYDIIQKSGTDLNEISFLSTHCDLIVGRSSGVFTFSVVKENLFERKISLISFSHLMAGQPKFWIGQLLNDKVNYSSNIFATGESDTKKVLEMINRSL